MSLHRKLAHTRRGFMRDNFLEDAGRSSLFGPDECPAPVPPAPLTWHVVLTHLTPKRFVECWLRFNGSFFFRRDFAKYSVGTSWIYINIHEQDIRNVECKGNRCLRASVYARVTHKQSI